MSGKAIGKSMNFGYPGTYSKNSNPAIAARIAKLLRYGSTTVAAANINFGDAVVLVGDSTGGQYEQAADYIAGGGTFSMANFGGFAVREIKSFESYMPAPTLGYYGPGAPVDVIRKGTLCVTVGAGTPQAGDKVYLRVQANSGVTTDPVGGIEAAVSDSTTGPGTYCVELTNCKWKTGLVDDNNVAEIEMTYAAQA
jgi:hypothetical protein